MVLAGMVLGLALFYRGGALSVALVGLLIFGALVLLRPDLGLLFVPLAAPLYLIPAAIEGIRPRTFLLPLHEAVLLVVLGAVAARWLLRLATGSAIHTPFDHRITPADIRRFAPELLFLLAGTAGVLVALNDPEPRSAALREFRRLIVEPVLFYALLKYSMGAGARHRETDPGDRASRATRRALLIVGAFVLGGALVGLLGLLQFAGVDVVEPLFGQKQAFSENVIEVDGVRRVTSVYGHPNNLGLYLGRVWPIAAVLAIAQARRTAQRTKPQATRLPALFFGICALLCLGGIVVSFSRGAWLGAAAALGVLVFYSTTGARGWAVSDSQRAADEGRTNRRAEEDSGKLSLALLGPGSPRLRLGGVGSRRVAVGSLAALSAALVLVGGLAVVVRGGLASGSAGMRVLLWREAAALLGQHPLGIGLDQFYYYHNPEFGRSRIDPVLVGTSEQFASHPHNLALNTWLSLGPLGLVAFTWLIVRFFRAALHGARAAGGAFVAYAAALSVGALAAMVAALLHGLVDNFYFVPDLAFAFWLLLALAEVAAACRPESSQ